MITRKANGGRTIELFVPYEWLGTKVESIVIRPLMLDHVLRWQKGMFKDSFDLLVEMSGMKADAIRQLRYPDADRVLATFFEMLPPEIQASIQRGEIPAASEELAAQREAMDYNEPQHNPTPDGSGGFDLGDEDGGS